jgi:hypothetical protein
MRSLLALAPLLLLVGCAQTYSFQVAVRNETKHPLTVGLAKEGGKYEQKWQTPEQAAMRTSSKDERGWDSVVVQPGETQSAGPVKGDFSGGALATLRVYAGDLELSDVLSISRESPNRVDIPLDAGRNAVVIHEEAGKLFYEKVKLPPEKKK